MSHPCALVSTLQRAIAPTSQRQRACMKVLCRQCVRLATPQVSRVLHVSCTFLHSRVMKKKKNIQGNLGAEGYFRGGTWSLWERLHGSGQCQRGAKIQP